MVLGAVAAIIVAVIVLVIFLAVAGFLIQLLAPVIAGVLILIIVVVGGFWLYSKYKSRTDSDLLGVQCPLTVIKFCNLFHFLEWVAQVTKAALFARCASPRAPLAVAVFLSYRRKVIMALWWKRFWLLCMDQLRFSFISDACSPLVEAIQGLRSQRTAFLSPVDQAFSEGVSFA